LPYAYLFNGKRYHQVDLELLKEGVNLTFEFRDDELEEPLKFTFIHGMAFIFTTTAIEEFPPRFFSISKTFNDVVKLLPPQKNPE
jgi:hypothetical protein